jgi:hypothetical protein
MPTKGVVEEATATGVGVDFEIRPQAARFGGRNDTATTQGRVHRLTYLQVDAGGDRDQTVGLKSGESKRGEWSAASGWTSWHRNFQAILMRAENYDKTMTSLLARASGPAPFIERSRGVYARFRFARLVWSTKHAIGRGWPRLSELMHALSLHSP